MENLFLGMTQIRKREPRDRQIAFRLTQKEFKELEKVANYYTGGNYSDFIRIIFLQWLQANMAKQKEKK